MSGSSKALCTLRAEERTDIRRYGDDAKLVNAYSFSCIRARVDGQSQSGRCPCRRDLNVCIVTSKTVLIKMHMFMAARDLLVIHLD